MRVNCSTRSVAEGGGNRAPHEERPSIGFRSAGDVDAQSSSGPDLGHFFGEVSRFKALVEKHQALVKCVSLTTDKSQGGSSADVVAHEGIAANGTSATVGDSFAHGALLQPPFSPVLSCSAGGPLPSSSDELAALLESASAAVDHYTD